MQWPPKENEWLPMSSLWLAPNWKRIRDRAEPESGLSGNRVS
jgi:hypothetical protein